MKNVITPGILLLSLSLSLSLIISGCDTKERESFIPAADQTKVFGVDEIKDVSSEQFSAIHYQDETGTSQTAFDKIAKSSKVKLSGKLKALVGKIDEKEAPGIKTSPVAFCVMGKELYVYQVVSTPATATDVGTDNKVVNPETFSIQEIRLKKALLNAKDAEASLKIQDKLDEVKKTQKSDEAIFKLVARFKIDTIGVLTNKRSDYGERKAALTVKEYDSAFATHLQISGERADKKEEAPEEKK